MLINRVNLIYSSGGPCVSCAHPPGCSGAFFHTIHSGGSDISIPINNSRAFDNLANSTFLIKYITCKKSRNVKISDILFQTLGFPHFLSPFGQISDKNFAHFADTANAN